MKFATFFYPGYYQCRRRNAAAGRAIDEWALLSRSVQSTFTNVETIVPLLGCTDQSDPSVLESESALAHEHGVDAFIFNFYFDGVLAELEKPLEEFSALKTSLNFAINLCCHMPKRKLPFGMGEDNIALCSYWDDAQFKGLAEHLCERYIQAPNYLCIGGCAVVTFYHVNGFRYLYGPRGLAEKIKVLRKICASKGISLHVVGLFSVVGGWKNLPADAASLPFDSYSCYVVLPEFAKPQPLQSFPELADRWIKGMTRNEWGSVEQKLIACVGAGWNATYRGESGYDPDVHGLRFPYFPIVVNDDPSAFEKYLRVTAATALRESQYSDQLLFLGPWNEWSEGCYLLPDQRFGFGKLKAVKGVKDTLMT